MTISEGAIADIFQVYANAVSGDDVEAVLVLYSDTAEIEDPVGSEVLTGKDQLRDFYIAAVESIEKIELESAPRVKGLKAACAMRAYPKGMNLKFHIEIISVLTFDTEGKITQMVAYWGDQNMITA